MSRVYKPIPPLSAHSAQLFWSRVEKTAECWLWHGFIDHNGYGVINLPVDGGWSKFFAHRVAFSLDQGECAVDQPLDHLCRKRNCVNPSHLESVTHAINIARGMTPVAEKAQQIVCLKCGSELTIVPRGNFGTQRRCLRCHNNYLEARREEHIAYLRAWRRRRKQTVCSQKTVTPEGDAP